MPAVVKKSPEIKEASALKQVKKQTLKKTQKTESIKAAKKLDKLKAKKAISEKLNRTPHIQRQKTKHRFDPVKLNRGVVLVHNLPHGFFEDQLKNYFNQYGHVTRLRVARSEKTGVSKAYAYIEFKYPAVAEVAAQSMNNYFMFRQVLKTVYIPPKEQKYDYFRQPVKFIKAKGGIDTLSTPATRRADAAIFNFNKPVTKKQHAYRTKRSTKKLEFLQKKLAAAGINIDLSTALYDPATKKKGKKNQKKDKNQANSSLENLLENTINSSDEESNDDDYKPTKEEFAEADAFINRLLLGGESDSENDAEGVDEEQDTDNDEDEDFGSDFKENDNTLNRFLENTIDSEEELSDDDYIPTEQEIAEAKSFALAAAEKLAKQSKKKPAPVENSVAPKSLEKKNKKNATVAAKPKSPEKRKLSKTEEIAADEPSQKKKKKANLVVEPVTPPLKVRKNFVSPPTPTPTPEPSKKAQKSKVKVVAPVVDVSPVPVKQSKPQKNSAAGSKPTKKQQKQVALAPTAVESSVPVKQSKPQKNSAAGSKPTKKQQKQVALESTVVESPVSVKQNKPQKNSAAGSKPTKKQQKQVALETTVVESPVPVKQSKPQKSSAAGSKPTKKQQKQVSPAKGEVVTVAKNKPAIVKATKENKGSAKIVKDGKAKPQLKTKPKVAKE